MPGIRGFDGHRRRITAEIETSRRQAGQFLLPDSCQIRQQVNPVNRNSFRFATFASHSGVYSDLVGLNLGNVLLNPLYDPTRVTLVAS